MSCATSALRCTRLSREGLGECRKPCLLQCLYRAIELGVDRLDVGVCGGVRGSSDRLRADGFGQSEAYLLVDLDIQRTQLIKGLTRQLADVAARGLAHDGFHLSHLLWRYHEGLLKLHLLCLLSVGDAL